MDDSNGGGRAWHDKTRRSFGARAFLFWVLALGAGGAAAYLIHGYVKSSVKVTPTTVTQIAFAAMDLELATTLKPEHVVMANWPDSVPAPQAFHQKEKVVGLVLINKVVKGQILLEPMFAAKNSGRGLAALIPANMRAVAVAVDDVVGVAGFIHPGDKVDVVVTLRPSKPDNAEPMSKVILQNVEVLTVGKEIETKDNSRNKPIPVTVATLLVTPEESEKLALAANQGRILLTLRSRLDTSKEETHGMVPSVLLGGAAQAILASATPLLPNKPTKLSSKSMRIIKDGNAIPPVKQTVEILRGDRFEQRKFEVKEAP